MVCFSYLFWGDIITDIYMLDNSTDDVQGVIMNECDIFKIKHFYKLIKLVVYRRITKQTSNLTIIEAKNFKSI